MDSSTRIINQRGFCIDRDLAKAAYKIAKAVGPRLMPSLLSYRGCCHRRQSGSKLQAWLQQNDCAVKDLQQKTVMRLLESELPPRFSVYWSSAKMVAWLRPKRSTRCYSVPAPTIVCAEHCSFTKHPLVAGPGKDPTAEPETARGGRSRGGDRRG